METNQFLRLLISIVMDFMYIILIQLDALDIRSSLSNIRHNTVALSLAYKSQGFSFRNKLWDLSGDWTHTLTSPVCMVLYQLNELRVLAS